MFSIWLVPPKPLHTKLTAIVEKLAREYGGPVFEPHLTLIGGVPMDEEPLIEKARQLATQAAPLELELEAVAFSTTYFQSVFVRVKPTVPLLELNVMASEMFAVPNTLFMPHLSLLYGEHPMAIRAEAAATVVLEPEKFVVDHMTVIPATFDPKGWTHQAELPFTLH